MKLGIKIFYACLFLNCAVFIVNNGGFAPQPNLAFTNFDINQTIDAYNTTKFSGTPTVSSFFDIGRGIVLLGNLIVTATVGFPKLLWDLGMPWFIYLPFTVIDLASIAFTFIEMWSGSTQTDVYY